MNLPLSLPHDEWDLIVKVIAGTAAIVAFVIGLWQYKRGQKWQKAQVLLALIDSFERDKRIEAACATLDWDAREVQLGEERSIKFENKMLVSALRVPVMDIAVASLDNQHRTPEPAVTPVQEAVFTPEESMIRDAFDAFFDFFHKLYAFQRTGLLKFSDYVYFNYWFELLRDIGKYKDDREIQRAMERYIQEYHFVGVQELLQSYQKHPEPLSIMSQGE